METLHIPSISSTRSSTYTDSNDYSYIDDGDTNPIDQLMTPFISSPRPESLFSQKIFNQTDNVPISLPIKRWEYSGDLSPISELPELVYDAVKLLQFENETLTKYSGGQCCCDCVKRIRCISSKRGITSGDRKRRRIGRRSALKNCFNWMLRCVSCR